MLFIFILINLFLPVFGDVYTTMNGEILHNNNVITIKGINWFGFDVPNIYCVQGLDYISLDDGLIFLKNNGFNAIRLPFSPQTLYATTYPQYAIDFIKNPRLKGINTLQILDIFVKECELLGILILFDLQTLGVSNKSETSHLPFNDNLTIQQVADIWKNLVSRYINSPNILGADTFNEANPVTWDVLEGYTSFLGNEILSANPNILIFATGASQDANSYSLWGEDFVGVYQNPLQLSIPNKVIYSAHVYGPSVFNSSEFSDPTYPNNMPAIWDNFFGFIVKNNLGTLVIGEWGSLTDTLLNLSWSEAITQYFLKNKIQNTFWWCYNPMSQGTGGIVENDWVTPNYVKLNYISKVSSGSILTFLSQTIQTPTNASGSSSQIMELSAAAPTSTVLSQTNGASAPSIITTSSQNIAVTTASSQTNEGVSAVAPSTSSQTNQGAASQTNSTAALDLSAGTNAPLLSTTAISLTSWTNGIASLYGGDIGTPAANENGATIGSCGYGVIPVSTYPYLSIGALATESEAYKNGPVEGCGTCYQISCVNNDTQLENKCNNDWQTQSITIMITDSCPECAKNQFDIQAQSFGRLAPEINGRIAIKYRRVTCTPNENIKVIISGNNAGAWLRVFITNIAGSAGIKQVNIRSSNSNSPWLSMSNIFGGSWEIWTQPPQPSDLEILTDDNQSAILYNVITKDGSGSINTNTQISNVPLLWNFPISSSFNPSIHINSTSQYVLSYQDSIYYSEQCQCECSYCLNNQIGSPQSSSQQTGSPQLIESAPDYVLGNSVDLWHMCGGDNGNNQQTKNCTQGTCQRLNDYYWQCR